MHSLVQGKGCCSCATACTHLHGSRVRKLPLLFTWSCLVCLFIQVLNSPTARLQSWAITGTTNFSPGLLPNLEVVEVAPLTMGCTLLEGS